ncbi:MAG: chromosome segregation protein SMC [Gemmatimonadetes bacterium]|nr:chromosome segregation protein SMC [Gemmatimonadota bacterium]
MRLTKLELQGFKSFADSTELKFEPGVTAIVGPNGCGKSNVSDAVRWVLGEQRARLLRGAKMEEVIFQGSSARRPVNIAEVSLFFENDDGQLPVPFREVVITRRLSRSGESEYLLNNAQCRLRDIHDLVRGTGLGAESGVVIESKMIDALLSDRPDDRRELFEEAAGVGLYRDRRRSTERSLEQTGADLARLDDLISEVTTQVRSLARQRKKAERHVEIMARKFAVEITLAAREMSAWHGELQQLDVQVRDLRVRQPEAVASELLAGSARESAQGARAAAEQRRTDSAREAADRRESMLKLQGDIAVAEERHRNAVERLARAEQERTAGMAEDERVQNDVNAADADVAAATRAVESAAAARDAAVAAEDVARNEVMASRERLAAAEQALRGEHDNLRRLELEIEAADRELAEVVQRTASLVSEHQALAGAEREAATALGTADAALAEAERQSTIADGRLAEAQRAEVAAHDAEVNARADARRLDEEETALSGRVDGLEGLERERVGLAPAAARLLRDKEQFGEGAVVGPLTDFIAADTAAASQVERFLGATAHAVVVRDSAVAERIRRWHANAHPGALLLLPLDAPALKQLGAPEALATLVRAEGAGGAWVRALLGKVQPVDDGAAFVDSRGAVWLPGTTSAAGPLRRRAELFALRADLASLAGRKSAAAETIAAAQAALAAATEAVVMAREAATLAHGERELAARHRSEAERARQVAGRALADAVALSAQLTGRKDALTTRVGEGSDAMANARQRIAAATQVVEAGRTAAADAERGQDSAREARSAAQVNHAQVEAKRAVAVERRERLAREHETARSRLASLQLELDVIATDDAALGHQVDEWRVELDARQAAATAAETALHQSEDALGAADVSLRTADAAFEAARAAAATLANDLHHAELRQTELGGRRAAIRERLETEWRRPLDEMLATHEPLDTDDDSLRTEAEALRAQVEQLGPVNPLAIEEHTEEQKRLELLETQRTDVAQARESLQQAIREIDTTAREMFLKTFDEVRAHFRHIFLTLFGGGECDLRLENPDAPLDCDIEIHASPKGKKTQRIHLLSSGERALVALSLLFGIFLTKPSPFCLLDEVDAPLDDQNIGRFVRMLNEFKKNTQFIVITHNPRTTTEASDAVYGVTMQEPGVSSLVSVRMRGQAVDLDGDATSGPAGSAAGAAA